jgi:hypothetical protein
MITIHWLWIPLIIVGILLILDFMSNDFRFTDSAGSETNFMVKASLGFFVFISLLIYTFYGFAWLFNHINITT